MAETLDQLVAAADGLLVTSESDYPFLPFVWTGPGPLTPAALLAHLGLPPTTPVAQGDPETFLAAQARARDGDNRAGRDQAARLVALARLFATLLADRVCYRVGAVEIQVFLAGTDAEGSTVGLSSTLVET